MAHNCRFTNFTLILNQFGRYLSYDNLKKLTK